MGDALRVNGNAYGWGSCVFKLADERYTGITSIDYEDKLETVMLYGATRSHAPVGQTGGKYVPGDVTVTMRKDSAKAFIAALSARSRDGKSYGHVYFEGVVQYIEPDNTPHVDLLHRMRCGGIKNSAKEGGDPLTVDITMTTQAIERDGKTLYDQTGGSL
jgi:hypothetical protein